jgi:hypothetical protein
MLAEAAMTDNDAAQFGARLLEARSGVTVEGSKDTGVRYTGRKSRDAKRVRE